MIIIQKWLIRSPYIEIKNKLEALSNALSNHWSIKTNCTIKFNILSMEHPNMNKRYNVRCHRHLSSHFRGPTPWKSKDWNNIIRPSLYETFHHSPFLVNKNLLYFTFDSWEGLILRACYWGPLVILGPMPWGLCPEVYVPQITGGPQWQDFPNRLKSVLTYLRPYSYSRMLRNQPTVPIVWLANSVMFPSQVCSTHTVCPAFTTKERVVQSILPGANTLGSVGMLTWQNLTSTALSLVHSIHWRDLSAIGWQESGQWSDWKLVHLDMFVSPSTTGDGEVSTYSDLHRKMRVKRNRKRQLGSKSFFLVTHT
jgi:hypothetical protein